MYKNAQTFLTCKAYWVKIHIAGSLPLIKAACQNYCDTKGLCVTVTPTDYIYTGGHETGATVRLINYPRFPKSDKEIEDIAEELAHVILVEAGQESFTIETPIFSKFYSWREQDQTQR